MHFDVFNNDAFSLSHLSRAMVDLPHQPGRIGELGWFAEEGISTLSLSIESMGSSLSLVQSTERGAPATAVHIRDIVKQVFAFAILHGEKVENPADDVKAASIATFVPKDRALTPTEIRLAFHQLESIGCFQ